MNIEEHQAQQRSFVNQAYESKDTTQGVPQPSPEAAVQGAHSSIVMERRAHIAAQIARTYAPAAAEPTSDTELG